MKSQKLDKEIAFIGSGNMAISILSGLLNRNDQNSEYLIRTDQRSRVEEFGVGLLKTTTNVRMALS